MNKTQASYLKKKIRELVILEIDHSWGGSYEPEERDRISVKLQKKRKEINDYISRCSTKSKLP